MSNNYVTRAMSHARVYLSMCAEHQRRSDGNQTDNEGSTRKHYADGSYIIRGARQASFFPERRVWTIHNLSCLIHQLQRNGMHDCLTRRDLSLAHHSMNLTGSSNPIILVAVDVNFEKYMPRFEITCHIVKWVGLSYLSRHFLFQVKHT